MDQLSTAKHTRLKGGKGEKQNKINLLRQLFTRAKKEREMKTNNLRTCKVQHFGDIVYISLVMHE
jgi:hypothetical protein